MNGKRMLILTLTTLLGFALVSIWLSLISGSPSMVRAAGPWYVAPGGSNSNSCLSSSTPCATINGAIGKANPGDTIYIASGTYIGTGLQVVLINKNITLSGGWDETFTIQGGTSTVDGENLRRCVTVENGMTASVEQITVQNGEPTEKDGGGIHNEGVLSMNNTIIRNNHQRTVGGNGGGIYNASSGELTLNNSSITHNGSLDISLGSGIYNEGNFSIYNSIISENNGTGQHSIESTVFNYGVMTITHSIVRDNMDGGGIVNTCESSDCEPMGKITLINSAILNNDGGSGINNYGIIVVENSTISGNMAYANEGGGIRNDRTAYITNSTISGNSAYHGGGIFNRYGTMYLSNSTLSNNAAEYYGGGIYSLSEPSHPGIINMQNTILAGNESSEDSYGPDCFTHTGMGEITSDGYNLIGNTSGCNFITGTGDLINVNPKLDVLEGIPGYHLLGFNSPAVNAGNPGGCSDHLGTPLPFDQRGLPRVGHCDIGAVEMQSLEWSDKTVNESSATTGTSSTYTITLRNLSEDNLSNVVVTDTLPISVTYEDSSLQATSGLYGYDNGVINWSGSVDAGGEETITFNAMINWDVSSGTYITNSATIEGGGDIITRTATTVVIPHQIFLPCVTNNFCSSLYSDDFSDPNSSWPVGDDGNVRYGYFNGEYFIGVGPEWWAGASPGYQASNYILAVDVRNPNNSLQSSYGLLFGLSDDWNQFYTFEITADGYYGVYRYDSGSWTSLTDGFSNNINTGPAKNQLKVKRDGTIIEAYANGQLLASVSDGAYTGTRYVGLFVNNDAQYLDTWIYFDDFAAYPVTCNLAAIQSDIAIQAPNLKSLKSLEQWQIFSQPNSRKR